MTSELMTKATDIISIITACIIICLILSFVTYLGIQEIKTEKLKKEFKDKLMCEHDKALIMDYENTKWTLKKGNKKK